MGVAVEGLFSAETWRPALEKYGAVTHLTVALFGAGGERIDEPVPPTPLFAALTRHGFEPGAFADCARCCLAQVAARPAVVVTPAYGLGVVGTSLVLDGEVVGAAVAGYALVDFPSAAGIERLAREAGLRFPELWEIARQQPPVPRRRLTLHGELLQVLGDTLLRESYRTRQYEEAAARLQAEAAAKDEFLAVLSHELRNPLAPLCNAVHVLESPGANGAAAERARNMMSRQVQNMTRLIDDLLDVSRITQGKIRLRKKPAELAALLAGAVELTRVEVEARGQELSLTLPREPVQLDADPTRMEQVFGNLLNNASKFSPKGGHLAVTAELAGNGPQDPGEVVVRVRDDGIGIAPETLPRVFDLFMQADRSFDRPRGGLGIGLALVRRLVEMHGGSVEAHSAGLGQGSELVVRLPVLPPADTEAERHEAGAGRSSGAPSPRRVLVVDDNEDAAESLAFLLRLKGHAVEIAHDGSLALETATSFRPEVVLLDIGLPGLDGYQVASELRQRPQTAKALLVALTGYGQEEDQRRAGEAGFDHHLTKPVDPQVIYDLLDGPRRVMG